MTHPADYAGLAGSILKERMGRSFAIPTFSGTQDFFLVPPIMAALMPVIGWCGSLMLAGVLGVPLVGAILWQNCIQLDQARPKSLDSGSQMSGRELLMTRPILLFFGFFLLSSMAGAGIQSWLITVLHQVKGMSVETASTTLTCYMAGTTSGVLVSGYVADRIQRHLAFAATLTSASAALLLLVASLPLPERLIFGVMFGSGLAIGCSRTPRDLMVKDGAPPGCRWAAPSDRCRCASSSTTDAPNWCW